MQDIAIYGAGGLGREIKILIDRINNTTPHWNFIGFFDDGIPKGTNIHDYGIVLGGIQELNQWSKDLSVALCFGNSKTLKKVKEKINNNNISFPNLIDPSFYMGDPKSLKLGEGNIIQGCFVGSVNISIGDFNLFNGDIWIGHDVHIGNYNIVMPGARISGEVIMGNNNLIGADSFIKQQIKIGNNITLSPLSALLTKPKDGNTYIGNPAKIFKF